MAIELQPVRTDYLNEEKLQALNIRLGLLRLDELHPLIQGNKWFKLRKNIALAKERGADSLLTFGGAFSNHLLAAAAAAKHCGMSAIGMVRGWHGRAESTATLEQCRALGMTLHFLSREDYTKKTDSRWLSELQQRFPRAHFIPEGGDNAAGMEGAAEIADYVPENVSLVALPVGTGTTFAGIRSRLDPAVPMLGLPVMNGGNYLAGHIKEKLPGLHTSWNLDDSFAFGGFARYTEPLIRFMNTFYEKHRIPLDFVYTGKMMYALYDKIDKGIIASGSHVLAIHTGGLQGNSSISHLLSY